MATFKENRPYIEHEFEEAVWDAATGCTAEELTADLTVMQAASGDRPRPTALAEMYAYVLDHVQLQINPHTPFALKFNIGVNYTGFATTDIFQRFVFEPQREKVLGRYYPAEHRRMQAGGANGMGYALTDYWHTVPNWGYILENGFGGILREAERSKAALSVGEEEKALYLDAVICCYRAILRFLERVYTYSLTFDIPHFSACIKALTERAPETLYEVMMLSVLYV